MLCIWLLGCCSVADNHSLLYKQSNQSNQSNQSTRATVLKPLSEEGLWFGVQVAQGAHELTGAQNGFLMASIGFQAASVLGVALNVQHDEDRALNTLLGTDKGITRLAEFTGAFAKEMFICFSFTAPPLTIR